MAEESIKRNEWKEKAKLKAFIIIEREKKKKIKIEEENEKGIPYTYIYIYVHRCMYVSWACNAESFSKFKLKTQKIREYHQKRRENRKWENKKENLHLPYSDSPIYYSHKASQTFPFSL